MTKEKVIPQIRFSGFTDTWEQRKLGEISESFEYGLNAAATEYDGKHKYIRITDIDDSTHLFIQDNLTSPDIDFSTADDYLLQAGDVLFARTGASVGKTYIYRSSDGDLYFAGFIIRAKIKRNYDADFVFQNTLTDNYDSYIRITSQRSGQPGVNAQEYANFALSVPCLAEQKKIGAYFTNLDNLITLHQRKYDKLQIIKKAMLEKMFPQNGSCFPEIRFKGFTDSWEQRKFDKWGDFYYGHSCPKWSVTEDATIPCIRYGELYTKFGAKIDKVYSYTNMPTEKLRFSKGTEVLIPRVGEDPMDYNHCTWLSLKDVAIGEMISVFNTDQDPLFSATMFNATLQKEFAIRVEGGSVTNLYFDKLRNIDISYPLLAEQKKIAAFFENLDHLITLHQREVEKLQNIKKSMLETMFV